MRKQRVISAIILLLIVAVTVTVGGYLFSALVLMLATIGILEYNNAMREKGFRPMISVSAIFLLIMLLQGIFKTADCFSLNLGSGRIALINWSSLLIVAAVMLALTLAVFKNGKYTPADAAVSLFGGFYVVILSSYFIAVRGLGEGFDGLFCFLLAFLPDIGADSLAYEIGSRFGHRPLIPKVSPKKSVEGSIAAFAASIVISLILGLVFTLTGVFTAVPLWVYPLVGLGTGLISQVGDLAASIIKRFAGVKDFGKLIPGHGGVLDRLDSLLFVFPLVYFVLRLIV